MRPLSVSIGLAPTKVLAKIASNWMKPNGLTIIDCATASDFLSKVPVGKIWGIGPKTSEALIRKGINTALDFSTKEISWVRQNFSKPYEAIWRELNGILVTGIDSELKTIYSSIQKTRTFHPSTNDKTFLWSQLSKHIEDACKKARHYNLVPNKIATFLKTQDFKYVTISIALPVPSSAPEILTSLIHPHFEKMHTKGILYRTAGVTLQDLMHNHTSQKDLFGGTIKADKFDLIHQRIDSLENKFGKRVVYLGSTQKALEHKEKWTVSEDVEQNLLFL